MAGRRPITVEELRNVCKAGQGNDTCRYILCDNGGYHCAKTDEELAEIKEVLDRRAENHQMIAQGDNCPGT